LKQLTDDEKVRLKSVYNALPTDRAAAYLDVSDRNPFAALSLYAWNSQIAGALHETLGHFEIVFRNRMDEALTSRHQFRKRKGDWLDNLHGELTTSACDAIALARAGVREP
jgi:hypothetical protein